MTRAEASSASAAGTIIVRSVLGAVPLIALACLCTVVFAQEGGSAPPREEDAPPPMQQTTVRPEVAESDPLLDAVRGKMTEKARPAEEQRVVPRQQGRDDAAKTTLTGAYYLRAIMALCAVVALILVLAYAARRFGAKTALLPTADLGEVIGRVYLARGQTLYYVRTGGRVLVIGATNSAMRTISEFDEAAFQPTAIEGENDEFDPDSFLGQLTASSKRMTAAKPDGGPVEVDDIAALRGQIQRLQERIREDR